MAQKVIQGAVQAFVSSHGNPGNVVWADYFNICGSSDLTVHYPTLYDSDLFPQPAPYVVSKHVVDFRGEASRFTVKVDGNKRETSVSHRIRVNDVDTEQWCFVPPNRMGVFICTGAAATFVEDDSIVGFRSSAVATPLFSYCNLRAAYWEMEPDSGERSIYRVAGFNGSIENDGVPPPAWASFPLAGSLDHYRSGQTLSAVVGDLDDTEKPLTFKIRANGKLSYFQISADPTIGRSALVGLRVNGSPDADWDTPPFPFNALSAADNPLELRFRINMADTAEIVTDDIISTVAYDQPVGVGGNIVYGIGVNWKGGINNALIDHGVQESEFDSYFRGTAFQFVSVDSQAEKVTEWFASGLGTFHPRHREEIEAHPLGWDDIEIESSFDIRFQNIRAYLDENTTGVPLFIGIARNDGAHGAYGDLQCRVDVDPGWYEDEGNRDPVTAGKGWCLRFKARPDDANAIMHISMVAFSYREHSSRDCVDRVLPAPDVVTALPCSTRLARAVRITRTDGEVFAYTEHDEDINYDGTLFKSTSGFQGSASELGAVQGEVGNMEVSGFVRELGIPIADLYGGKFDGAEAEVWLLPWGEDYGILSARRIAGGTFGKVTQEGVAFRLEALSLSAYMKQRALLEVVTPTCRYELGDSRCTVNLESLTVTGVVSSVDADENGSEVKSHRSFIDVARTEAAGWFTEGSVTFTTGQNTGQTARVKLFSDGGGFTLWEPLIYAIAPYDEYTAVVGCDKVAGTCKTKFDNFVNFGGYPTVPGLDATSQSPSGRMGE